MFMILLKLVCLLETCVFHNLMKTGLFGLIFKKPVIFLTFDAFMKLTQCQSSVNIQKN